MKGNSISRLAKLFRDRDNPNFIGVITGIVEAGFPDIKIRIHDQVVLEKEDLIFSAHILENYQREFSFTGKLDFDVTTSGTIFDNNGSIGKVADVTSLDVPIVVPPGHIHNLPVRLINNLQASNADMSGTGTIKWTDTLEAGDTVILMAAMNNQRFYVVDKGVSL